MSITDFSLILCQIKNAHLWFLCSCFDKQFSSFSFCGVVIVKLINFHLRVVGSRSHVPDYGYGFLKIFKYHHHHQDEKSSSSSEVLASVVRNSFICISSLFINQGYTWKCVPSPVQTFG